jgi:hypothetical protein
MAGYYDYNEAFMTTRGQLADRTEAMGIMLGRFNTALRRFGAT